MMGTSPTTDCFEELVVGETVGTRVGKSREVFMTRIFHGLGLSRLVETMIEQKRKN